MTYNASAPAVRADAAGHRRAGSGLRAAEQRILAALFVLTVVALPLTHHQMGPQTAFLPVVLSAVLVVDIVSAYLLVSRFRDTGDSRLLVMALAYVWSSIIVMGYALVFPGFVSDPSPLSSWPSAPPWLYLAWHVGFPVLLAVAWAAPERFMPAVAPAGRRRVAWRRLTCCAAVSTAVVLFVALLGEHTMPAIIDGLDSTRMTRLAGPPAIALTIVCALIITGKLRGRDGAERWAIVAAWICVADLLLTLYSRHRFSFGWYAGRSLTVVGSSLVFIAMLGEFTALQRRLISDGKQLRTQARTDDLTGVANRLALREALAARLLDGAGGALMILDLDRFKIINDSLGHEAGDAVIVETARRLEALCPNDLVVRLGGDEFAVVITSSLRPAAVATAMLEAIGRPFDLTVASARSKAYLGVSVGITMLGGQASPSEVLREADLALYRAKDGGRGRFAIFDNELREHALHRLSTEMAIRTALDDGGFVPELRPVVAVRDSASRGQELHPRLVADDGHLWLPPDLMEVAEESGLIVDIDVRMLMAAVRMIADDPDDLVGSLGVTVSTRTLVHPGLSSIIERVVRSIGVSTTRLVVHVSERVLLQDGEAASDAIAMLRAAGIRVGVDDFGTGYSVISYLRRFPVDFLKIDRALVDHREGGEESAAMMNAMLSIADALDLKIVTDGIPEPSGRAAG